MTSADVWFDMAVKLYDDKIAEPVLWLGDPCHFQKAQRKFKNCSVADMNNVIHYPWRIENTEYNSELSGFFHSENYIRCKDVCIKMMDRLDHVGMFSRLDREVYLKNIALWALKKISDTEPEALIMAENPHSHGQYLIYEMFLYLNIPVIKFIAWSIQPIVVLQQVQERKLITCETSFDIEEWQKMDSDLDQYVKRIAQSNQYEDFIPNAISTQKKSDHWYNRLSGMVSKRKIRELAVETYRNWKFILRKEYLPVNPQYLGVTASVWIRQNKKKKMIKEYKKNVEPCDLSQDYVFFALHYEPERTTNPDGGEFHDQLLAIIELRRILPDNVYIYVKEHPSQFYIGKGPRGRSPLFYSCLKRIHGVKLIDAFLDSSTLIKNSSFVSTITGTITLEASILGKKILYFGEAWFAGLPNTIRWHDELTIEEIMVLPKASADEIYKFLIDQKGQYGIPCFRNKEGVNDISSENKTRAFAEAEVQGVVHLVEKFWQLHNMEHNSKPNILAPVLEEINCSS